MSWKVEQDTPLQARIEVDGKDVSGAVWGYAIDSNVAELATLTLEVRIAEATVVGDREPRWVGLERVPAVALLTALRDCTDDRVLTDKVDWLREAFAAHEAHGAD